ncbi:MAG: endopeptidase La [Candidatus Fimenecus sp.]
MNPLVKDDFILPTVALRGLVVFPEMTLHFDIGRKKSISAVKNAMLNKQDIFLITQIDMSEEVGGRRSLFDMGVVCEIKQLVRLPSGEYYRVVVEGKYRAQLLELVEEKPHLVSSVRALATKESRTASITEADAMMRYAKSLFETYASIQQKIAPDIILGVQSIHSAGKLADYIAGNLPLEYTSKQFVLEELSAMKRLEKLCVVLAREIELLDAMETIEDRVQAQMDDNQREYYLREQLKAIAEELGEGESALSEAEKYRDRILALHLEKESEEKLLQECDRMARMQPTSPESAVSRSYLDAVLALPWNQYSKENLNLENARKILDKDHYGLDEVKERILELLAVRKLSPDVKGQIICLAGPPGVGKTSIAKSLAKAMNRAYTRVSLGGVHDEAEIRGHRKTYIGSMPGSIITAITRAGTMNPLILLDEIDKLASDYKGDPSSALLEALDPEQNNTFRDHYIEIPFDLSKVLFVTTANDVSSIPAPLLDRMEVIELYSYTAEEKFQIAKKHLVKKQLAENGLKPSQLRITDDALRLLIDGYTREAGVRKLERVIAKVMRKQAVKIADGYDKKITVRAADLEALLGARKYKPTVHGDDAQVGVVNGLAWTSVGGELLTVEAVVMDGTGKLELTGSLGDVMKESAKAACSFIRANAKMLGIDGRFYKEKDIHIHFPEGAVPKDGPSAGVTVTTALVSALANRPVRNDVAMTGEVTLTGKALPIGGLREKSMAAYKSGITTVFIPVENVPDLQKIDKTVSEKVRFIPVKTVSEILNAVLLPSRTVFEEVQAPKQDVLPVKKTTAVRESEMC